MRCNLLGLKEMSKIGVIMRMACAGLVSALSGGASVWASPENHCDGAYVNASAWVDAAYQPYETAYSGGSSHHVLDSARGTVELYRFLNAQPAANLAGIDHATLRYAQTDAYIADGIEETWRQSRWILERDDAAEAAADMRLLASWGVNVVTLTGPTPDWWLHTQDFEGLTDNQHVIADLMANNPQLEWFQFLVAASDAPWANHWHLAGYRAVGQSPHNLTAEDLAPYERLAEIAYDRYETGQGEVWLLVAALLAPTIDTGHPLADTLHHLQARVQDCSASGQEYALFAAAAPITAITWDGLDFALLPALPERLKALIERNEIFRLVSDGTFQSGLSEGRLSRLAYERRHPQTHIALSLADVYSASSVDALPDTNHIYAIRAYNLLSAQGMADLAARSERPYWLYQTAFARQVALERWQEAEALLDPYRAALEQEAHARPGRSSPSKLSLYLSDFDDLRASDLTAPVRLALIAIHSPGLSTLLKPHRYIGGEYSLYLNLQYHAPDRNLPPDYLDTAFMQRDFETWLRAPNRWGNYFTMHGNALDWVSRRKRRNPWQPERQSAQVMERYEAPRLIVDTGAQASIPFSSLIAHDEIVALGGDHRLMHTLSRVIIDWADENTDTRLERAFGRHELEAEALARLVRLCRNDSCGEINERPAQQRAFELLHYRMGDTVWAEQTPVWWESRRE
jgi:hypothetical protein